MIQQYVTFVFRGSFFSESTSEKVTSRVRPSKIPKNCYGYFFSERQEVESDGETLYGQMTKQSGMHYFGKTLNIEQVKAMKGDNAILVSNMEINNYELVVQTDRGNFQPFDRSKDKIVER